MKIEILPKAAKQLARLDKQAQKAIKESLVAIASLENPRSKGKALKGVLAEYWRYRAGDYRVICEIKDDVMTIVVVRIGDRKNVYA